MCDFFEILYEDVVKDLEQCVWELLCCELLKRFYEYVEYVEVEGGFVIYLDGWLVKMFGKVMLLLLIVEFGVVVVVEWVVQEKEINLVKMLLMWIFNLV